MGRNVEQYNQHNEKYIDNFLYVYLYVILRPAGQCFCSNRYVIIHVIQAYAWRLRPLTRRERHCSNQLCLGASDFAVSSEELAISVPLRQARITEDF